jgi:hypothetical protein
VARKDAETGGDALERLLARAAWRDMHLLRHARQTIELHF